jgi:16S rRNA (guanine527-N7)-methyltransferase
LEKSDIVVSRAFAELSDFVKDAAHLVAEDGLMFGSDEGRLSVMKWSFPRLAENLNNEFSSQCGDKLYVPQVEGERHLIVLKKS